jgi:hypothetical protein
MTDIEADVNGDGEKDIDIEYENGKWKVGFSGFLRYAGYAILAGFTAAGAAYGVYRLFW